MEATVQGNRVRVSCKAHRALAQDDSGEVSAEYLRDFLVRHLWCDYTMPSDRNLPSAPVRAYWSIDADGKRTIPSGPEVKRDGFEWPCNHEGCGPASCSEADKDGA